MNRSKKYALVATLVSGLIISFAGPVSADETSTATDPNAVVVSATKAAKAKGCTLKAKGNCSKKPTLRMQTSLM